MVRRRLERGHQRSRRGPWDAQIQQDFNPGAVRTGVGVILVGSVYVDWLYQKKIQDDPGSSVRNGNMGETPQTFIKCTKNLGGPPNAGGRSLRAQKKICLASPGLCSIGQYGHFNLLPLNILFNASREIMCPQTSFMGGLFSVVCWRRMGQANIEWYQHFFPRSTSIGSSSFWFHTPVHCRCSITAFMLINAGSATHPAEKLTLRGDSTERPSRAQASRVKMSQMSAHWFASSRWT